MYPYTLISLKWKIVNEWVFKMKVKLRKFSTAIYINIWKIILYELFVFNTPSFIGSSLSVWYMFAGKVLKTRTDYRPWNVECIFITYHNGGTSRFWVYFWYFHGNPNHYLTKPTCAHVCSDVFFFFNLKVPFSSSNTVLRMWSVETLFFREGVLSEPNLKNKW